MNIYWLGHSCFLMKTSVGKRIVTDPFDLDIGYIPYKNNVDIVTISHSHFDHNCTKYFDNDTRIITQLGTYEFDYCKITTFPSFHDNDNGTKRGQNIIFKYMIDGFNLCHLGDLGHLLSSDIIKALGYIDVLFVPVGDNFTINLDNIKKLIETISPRFIVPMHYKTHDLNFTLEGVDKFLLKMKNYKKMNSPVLSLNSKSLSSESTIVILDLSSNLNS